MAKTDGSQMVEVEDAVFRHYFRSKSDDCKSFWYQDVRVFRIGEAEKILAQEALHHDKINHIGQAKVK